MKDLLNEELGKMRSLMSLRENDEDAAPKEEEPKSSTEKSDKKGFKTNIEEDTINNTDFRRVLYTGEHLQLVLMTLKPEEEIGMETHTTIDQFFRFESGKGQCIINGNEYDVTDGDCVIIPAGSEHNIINTGQEPFTMYTIYTPPNHKDGVVFATKEDASKSEEKFDGKTTEQ